MRQITETGDTERKCAPYQLVGNMIFSMNSTFNSTESTSSVITETQSQNKTTLKHEYSDAK